MVDLLRTTLGDLLDERASQFPKNEVLVDIPQTERFTYHEFTGRVNQLAKGFIKLGLQKGDHVALWAPNSSQWIMTQFALAKTGAVLISVDLNYQLEQLDYLLRQSDSRCLVTVEGTKGSENIEMIKRLRSGEATRSPLPELKDIILISDRPQEKMVRWTDILDMGQAVSDHTLKERQRAGRDDDIVTILYTSGTTGSPKGVMSTHYGVINTTSASSDNQKLTENDRLCLSVPLSHMFGCICVVLAAVIKGACVVIPAQTFDPLKNLEAIERGRCSALYGSPSSFIAMMEHPEFKRFNLGTLRTGIMGGAQCPMEVMKRVVSDMGAAEIVVGYGQTEASSWITQTRPEDPLELRVSTVGRPLPNVEVKVIDPNSGQEVPGGVSGEICARGFSMKGYYKMPAATAHALDPQGWLHTGDVGTMDKEGYVRTSGRLKEVINKAGEMIYPTEIEEVLFTYPKVSNAQVFGVPNKATWEDVAAWIKLEEGTTASVEEILLHCRAKLPQSHIPRFIKFVEDFPMTPLGKIQKFKMREMAIKEYGLE
jgi:fatty-acyl-CoA synthase